MTHFLKLQLQLLVLEIFYFQQLIQLTVLGLIRLDRLLNFGQIFDKFPLHDLVNIGHKGLFFRVPHADDWLNISLFFLFIGVHGQVEHKLEHMGEFVYVWHLFIF